VINNLTFINQNKLGGNVVCRKDKCYNLFCKLEGENVGNCIYNRGLGIFTFILQKLIKKLDFLYLNPFGLPIYIILLWVYT
jgi:hypothetical protein